MARKLLVSIAIVTAVLPVGAASADQTIGVFTPTVPVQSVSRSGPCATVKSGGAAYNPSTGAYTIQPITVEFSSVTNCI